MATALHGMRKRILAVANTCTINRIQLQTAGAATTASALLDPLIGVKPTKLHRVIEGLLIPYQAANAVICTKDGGHSLCKCAMLQTSVKGPILRSGRSAELFVAL
jgi:hypothetical protein